MAYASRVLLIDDDPGLALTLRTFLERFGVPFLAVPNAEEAAREIKAEAPALCLVDLNLGSAIDGFTVLQGLRKKFGPALPLLAISGNSTPRSVARALESGANDFLAKPVDPLELKRKLNQYLFVAHEPTEPLAYLNTPPGGLRATIEFELCAEAAHELGLRASSRHYISPGTPVFLSSALWEKKLAQREFLATVSECRASGGYSYQNTFVIENLTADQKTLWRRCLHDWKRS